MVRRTMPVRDHLEPITDIALRSDMTVRELMDAMLESGGFTAKKVALASRVFEAMQKDGVTRILSFPAAMIATGARGIMRDLVRDRKVDAIITTCGTLDHDLARLWRDYYHGSFDLDDRELGREGVNRLGSILIPNECYGEILEERLKPIIAALHAEKPEWSTRDLIRGIGLAIKDEPKHEESILYWAAKNDIPVFVPGPMDGSVGSQLWLYWQQHRDFKLDLFADEQALMTLAMDAEELGAVMLGGGISKHHVIWWSQFRGGLDYAVYVTTAPEWDGSLSGAKLEEAISWGKVKEDARIVNVEGDATVILPLIVAGSMGGA